MEIDDDYYFDLYNYIFMRVYPISTKKDNLACSHGLYAGAGTLM